MPIDFPSSPSAGQQYSYNGVTYVYTTQGVWNLAEPLKGYTASSTPPPSPSAGNFWYDLSNGILSVYVNDGTSSQWVQMSPATVGSLFSSLECGRLALVSTTQLSFLPFKGDRIQIAGTVYSISPINNGIAGLTNTGAFINGASGQNLAASTVYFVYAFNNSGTITADFSTTGHATDNGFGNVGVEVKFGDTTRTLIGMIRTNASSQFVNSGSQRFLRSWFNSPTVTFQGLSYATASTTSTGAVVELGSGCRAEILVWAGEAVWVTNMGEITNSVAGAWTLGAIGVDAISAAATTGGLCFVPIASNYFTFSQVVHLTALSEGYHQLIPLGQVSQGTGSFPSTSYISGFLCGA